MSGQKDPSTPSWPALGWHFLPAENHFTLPVTNPSDQAGPASPSARQEPSQVWLGRKTSLPGAAWGCLGPVAEGENGEEIPGTLHCSWEALCKPAPPVAEH